MAEFDDQDEEEMLLQPGELFDDRYRIVKILGRGGIGVVYKAEDTEHHIAVALKVLLPSWSGDRKMVARFLREARLAIRVQHPSIVQILASGKNKRDGAPYLVMEFIEGITLLDHIKSFQQQSHKVGVGGTPIMRQLASVLAACHARGVVHRDLKPAKI